MKKFWEGYSRFTKKDWKRKKIDFDDMDTEEIKYVFEHLAELEDKLDKLFYSQSVKLTVVDLQALKVGDAIWIESIVGKSGIKTVQILEVTSDALLIKMGAWKKKCKYDNYDIQWKAYKLREQEETENGELLGLQCKAGDTVYFILGGEIHPCEVEAIEPTTLFLHFIGTTEHTIVDIKHLNSKIFTDKAQAEARLQELKEGK